VGSEVRWVWAVALQRRRGVVDDGDVQSEREEEEEVVWRETKLTK